MMQGNRAFSAGEHVALLYGPIYGEIVNVQETSVTEALRRWRIIPVIVIEDAKNGPNVAAALMAVDYCLEQGIPVFPGVATATEIEAVLEIGLNLMKLWPIETLGGIPFLELLQGPFYSVQFNPSGGVTAATFERYLALKNVTAVGGSWMAPSDWINARQFDRITEAVRQTTNKVSALGQRTNSGSNFARPFGAREIRLTP